MLFHLSSQVRTATIIIALLCLIFGLPSSYCRAEEAKQYIPPSQWWSRPVWSPDGQYVLVATPPPEKIENKGPDGTVFYGYQIKEGISPTKFKILRAANYLAQTTLALDLEYSSTHTMSQFPEWSGNGKYVSMDNRVRFNFETTIYDAASGQVVQKFRAKLWPMQSWAKQGAKLATEENGQYLIYEPSTKRKICLIHDSGDKTSFPRYCWSPNAECFALSNVGTPGVKIWDTHSGRLLKSIAVGEPISQMDWTPADKLVYFSAQENAGKIVWYDTKSDKVEHTIKTEKAAYFVFSPSHKLISYSDRDKLHILNASNWQEVCVLQGPRSGRFQVSWSPDERHILISQIPQGEVAVFDTDTGKALGHEAIDDHEMAHWTPDGKYIVVTRRNCPPLLLRFTENFNAQTQPPFPNAILGAPGWDKYAAPKNLEECLTSLDNELSAEQKNRFKNTPQKRLGEFGGGSIILDALIVNVEGNWDKTDLTAYFAKLGIDDPRDITGIVIDSYWRKLNGKPIDLDKQVRSHAAWWNRSKNFTHIDRPGSQKMLQFQGIDSRGNSFSVCNIKEKFKLVGFSEEGFAPNYISVLRKARKEFSPSQLAIILFIIPHDWEEDKRKLKVARPQAHLFPQFDPAKNPDLIIAKDFQANPDKNIYFMRLPREKCKELMTEENERSNMLFSPCRAFLYSGDRLKCIFNFDPDALIETVREEIDGSATKTK